MKDGIAIDPAWSPERLEQQRAIYRREQERKLEVLENKELRYEDFEWRAEELLRSALADVRERTRDLIALRTLARVHELPDAGQLFRQISQQFDQD